MAVRTKVTIPAPAAPDPVAGRTALLAWLARVTGEIHYVEDNLPRVPGLTADERDELRSALSVAWGQLANVDLRAVAAALAAVFGGGVADVG